MNRIQFEITQFKINPVGKLVISDLRGKSLAERSQKLQVTELNSLTCNGSCYIRANTNTHTTLHF